MSSLLSIEVAAVVSAMAWTRELREMLDEKEKKMADVLTVADKLDDLYVGCLDRSEIEEHRWERSGSQMIESAAGSDGAVNSQTAPGEGCFHDLWV